MKPTFALRLFLLKSAILAFASSNTAHAATKTWEGDTTTGSGGNIHYAWTNTSNWTGGTPTNDTTTDDALFTGTPANRTIYMSTNRSVKSLTFDSTTTSTPYTIYTQVSPNTSTAATLTLGTGGITVDAGSHTISGDKPTTGNGTLLLNGADFKIASDSALIFDVRVRHAATGQTYTKSGSGTLELKSNNGGSGGWSAPTFRIDEGVLKFSADAAFGLTSNAFSISAAGSNKAAIEITGGVTQSIGSSTGTFTLRGTGINNNGALRSLNGNNSFTSSGGTGGIVLADHSSIGVDANTLSISQTVSGGFNLTKVGAGTLTLSGANTYSGSTTVSEGTLAVTGTGSINNTSGITISSGAHFNYNSSTALTKPISNNGGTISGTGTITVDLGLNSTSDVISPGNSPGIQPYGADQTWSSMSYLWETNNFTGTTAGTDFDQIAITGNLSLTGAAAGSYILDLASLTAGNTAGNVPNFSEINRSWNILTTTGTISGFNASYWTIDTAGPTSFTSSPAWGGTWSIGLNGTNNALVLSYTAIPEPAAALLGGLGLLALLRRRRPCPY